MPLYDVANGDHGIVIDRDTGEKVPTWRRVHTDEGWVEYERGYWGQGWVYVMTMNRRKGRFLFIREVKE